jgi:hypothetical protein
MENRFDRAVGCTLCSAATGFSSFVRSNNPEKDSYSVVRRALDFTCRISYSGCGYSIRLMEELASPRYLGVVRWESYSDWKEHTGSNPRSRCLNADRPVRCAGGEILLFREGV